MLVAYAECKRVMWCDGRTGQSTRATKIPIARCPVRIAEAGEKERCRAVNKSYIIHISFAIRAGTHRQLHICMHVHISGSCRNYVLYFLDLRIFLQTCATPKIIIIGSPAFCLSPIGCAIWRISFSLFLKKLTPSGPEWSEILFLISYELHSFWL